MGEIRTWQTTHTLDHQLLVCSAHESLSPPSRTLSNQSRLFKCTGPVNFPITFNRISHACYAWNSVFFSYHINIWLFIVWNWPSSLGSAVNVLVTLLFYAHSLNFPTYYFFIWYRGRKLSLILSASEKERTKDKRYQLVRWGYKIALWIANGISIGASW